MGLQAFPSHFSYFKLAIIKEPIISKNHNSTKLQLCLRNSFHESHDLTIQSCISERFVIKFIQVNICKILQERVIHHGFRKHSWFLASFSNRDFCGSSSYLYFTTSSCFPSPNTERASASRKRAVTTWEITAVGLNGQLLWQARFRVRGRYKCLTCSYVSTFYLLHKHYQH